MDHLITSSLAIAAAVALLAGVVRGFAGFGAAMILTPVFSALYGPIVGVPVCLLVEFCIALPMLRGAIGLVDWKRIALLLAAAPTAAGARNGRPGPCVLGKSRNRRGQIAAVQRAGRLHDAVVATDPEVPPRKPREEVQALQEVRRTPSQGG